MIQILIQILRRKKSDEFYIVINATTLTGYTLGALKKGSVQDLFDTKKN